IYQCRRAVRHCAQARPDRGTKRMAARLGLHGCEKTQLSDEALVVRGELTADARWEGITDQLTLEELSGLMPPPLAFREPWEGTAGHQSPGRLRDHVVISRRAAAGKRGEIQLVPVDLPDSEGVAFEQIGHPGPVVEKTPDPGQADQADAEFDAARPVDAGQEGILLPPGAEMLRYPDGILLFAGEKPGGGQQGE